MTRLTGPLFSLDASGTIARTLTFSKWKGIPYVRTRVVPANPNTSAQQETRGVFATLNEMWKRMPAEARLAFQYAVRGQPLTARNRFVQANLAALLNDADLTDIILSVASGQAVPPTGAHTIDGGDGTFSLSIDMPTNPVGYTDTMPLAFAVLTGDPSPVLIRTVHWDEISAAGPAVQFDVPVDGVYEVQAVCYFTRDADGIAFASEPDKTRVTCTGN